MIEIQDLIYRVSKTKRSCVFEILRWNLVRQCIIGINKLVYDIEPQNPTAGRLIGAIITAPQALRDKLKAVFSVPIKAAPSMLGETTAEEAIWEEIEKMETQELQQAFDQYLPQLEEQWEWFIERK